MEKNTLYFVCSGNTCRSPMAERLVSHALEVEKKPLNEFRTDSFGVSAFPGSGPSENAVFVLSKVGIDLKDHRSQSPDQVDLDKGHAFFCMTQAHRETLLAFHNVDPERVFLLRQWLDQGPKEIPDPFGGGVEDYLICRDAIVEAIPSLIRFLKRGS